ncbi:MAG: lysophospholipid acyltransferase family protein [Chloroflexi bacterium]|nr:lysophospholipid acyltransferase family protein [Chloroflexota bacterium]
MIVLAHVLASALVRVVPPRLAYAVVSACMPWVLVAAPGFFRRARANMRQVLGAGASEAAVSAATLRSFQNYAKYMVDLLRLPSLSHEAILRTVEIHGWERVEDAFRMGAGVIFTTGHLGNWDMAAVTFVARSKRPVNVLVDTLKPPAWDQRVQGIRQRAGMNAIRVETGVRDIIAALRRKEGLAVLVDRPVGEDGVTVQFFGAPVRVPGGAAVLALRTGSPILPLAVVRKPDGIRYDAVVLEPIDTRGRGHSPAEVQALTQQAIAGLETLVRRYPEQWYMFRRMWQTQAPPGGA